MKKFIAFFICAVVTTVLMNFVYHWLGFDKAGTVSNLMPVFILFLVFYVFNQSSDPPKEKE
jgi:uncharacterized membrane protein YdjX (TVP38/TMEM64 family)